VRKPTENEVARAKEIMAKAGGNPLTKQDHVYANETILMANFPATVKLKLQAMRIGDLGIAAVPCEVFTEIGLKLKQDSPLKSKFIVSLANGYNHYLPSVEHHRLGGYETWRAQSSYLEVGA